MLTLIGLISNNADDIFDWKDVNVLACEQAFNFASVQLKEVEENERLPALY